MTNAKLIDGLRWCADESICCDDFSGEKCPYYDEKKDSCSVDEILHAAAAALEAADKKIAELEAQKPKRGEWIEKWRFKTDGTPFHKIGDMECSVCHGDMLGRYYSKYCPHCGALLRGEHDERTNKA